MTARRIFTALAAATSTALLSGLAIVLLVRSIAWAAGHPDLSNEGAGVTICMATGIGLFLGTIAGASQFESLNP